MVWLSKKKKKKTIIMIKEADQQVTNGTGQLFLGTVVPLYGMAVPEYYSAISKTFRTNRFVLKSILVSSLPITKIRQWLTLTLLTFERVLTFPGTFPATGNFLDFSRPPAFF